MSKKDYELIARCIRISKLQEPKFIEVVETVQNNLEIELGINNPRFDAEKFDRACSIENIAG